MSLVSVLAGGWGGGGLSLIRLNFSLSLSLFSPWLLAWNYCPQQGQSGAAPLRNGPLNPLAAHRAPPGSAEAVRRDRIRDTSPIVLAKGQSPRVKPLQTVQRQGVVPDVVNYNSLFSACETGKQPEKA